MKSDFKVILAILGATNVVFSILIPISVAMLIIVVIDVSAFSSTLVMITGICASAFRAIKVGFLGEDGRRYE